MAILTLYTTNTQQDGEFFNKQSRRRIHFILGKNETKNGHHSSPSTDKSTDKLRRL